LQIVTPTRVRDLAGLSEFCTSISDFEGVAFLPGRLSEEQLLATHTPEGDVLSLVSLFLPSAPIHWVNRTHPVTQDPALLAGFAPENDARTGLRETDRPRNLNIPMEETS
jgi:hypothetical protein